MFNPNPRRPLTRRQTARLVVGTAILAWATQLLLQQWGYGATIEEIRKEEVAAVNDVALGALLQNQTVERFVPPADARPARLELRAEATIVGEEVYLRQIARWNEIDSATFAPVADLVITRIGSGFKAITLAEVKSTLRDAGVNLASIHIVGPTKCTITRSDVKFDESNALDQWAAARQPQRVEPVSSDSTTETPTTGPAKIVTLATGANLAVTAQVDAPVADAPAPASLRGLLMNDLATRLNVPREQLQLDFKQSDEKLLVMSAPQFAFELDPVRVRNLGEVAWNVNITAGKNKQRVAIVAVARMWQNQLLAAKPIAVKQVIQADDLIERRVLVDRLPDAPTVAKEQVLGQQASRDIKAGMVLTAKLVDPIPLVRAGQLITITLSQGNIQIKTVARALEGGAYGQTIRVKNEMTKEVFQVVVTGAQTASISSPQLTSVDSN